MTEYSNILCHYLVNLDISTNSLIKSFHILLIFHMTMVNTEYTDHYFNYHFT